MSYAIKQEVRKSKIITEYRIEVWLEMEKTDALNL